MYFGEYDFPTFPTTQCFDPVGQNIYTADIKDFNLTVSWASNFQECLEEVRCSIICTLL
jgi:hypothetical protein